MRTDGKEVADLERRFWQSIVDQDTDTAVSMLTEPALMVSDHGVMKFDHAGYRQMAEKGSMVLRDFKLGDIDVMFPSDDVAVLTYKVKQTIESRGKSDRTEQEMADSSTWVRQDGGWRCAMHTETPVA